ncbi:hypothetical protein [Pleionea sp. CnH1-48]|uniref:phosphorylase family protein n=1 Tax=Pleionea sp. CnH1-48 TaxID=2954494 RepID=UPI002097E86F|nr:hypothetical protein [Pleionea sp. CnH1-48]MCO7227083.1 hypothetical protein [Pleionea sp. CnH1-48]
MAKIKRVAVLMAMEEEAQPIIDALGLSENSHKLDPLLPMKIFDGMLGSLEVSVVVSGKDSRYDVDNIGTQAATLSAFATIKNLTPDIIISAGTAGGFASRGADIGTVYLSDQHFVFHDRRVPLPGFDQSSIGYYPTLNVRAMANDLNLPFGVVSSGSSLEKSPKDIEVIEANKAVAKEMEAAAIAWVCWITKVPFFAIKSITNLLDEAGASEDQFLKNLEYSCEQLKHKVCEVMSYLSSRSIEELSD